MSPQTAETAPRERLQADERKDQIVQTVLRLVEERGADAVSTQLIADTIGRSQGIVFRHFPTNETLWCAVFDWLLASLESVWTKSLRDNASSPPLGRLELMFAGHLALIEKSPALAKIVLSDQLRQHYPVLNQRFANLHTHYEKHVLSLLNEARHRGDIRSNAPVADAATLYFSTIQGLGFQLAVAKACASQQPINAKRIFSLLIDGIAPAADRLRPRRQSTPQKNQTAQASRKKLWGGNV
jgi:TetR/AcrR family transcriptional regulator